MNKKWVLRHIFMQLDRFFCTCYHCITIQRCILCMHKCVHVCACVYVPLSAYLWTKYQSTAYERLDIFYTRFLIWFSLKSYINNVFVSKWQCPSMFDKIPFQNQFFFNTNVSQKQQEAFRERKQLLINVNKHSRGIYTTQKI